MSWRLRQVTSVVADLDSALADLHSELGLSVSLRGSGANAEAHGVDNAWLPLGNTFLEVVTPLSPEAAAGRFHARQGDGGYLVILQTDDLDAFRTRLALTGTRITWEIDEPGAQELHLDHRDVGGSLLAIDWANPPGSWRWAGADWESHVCTEVVTEIVSATIRTPSPDVVAARWGLLLDLEPVRHGDVQQIELERGTLRFLPSDDHGRGRLTGIDVGVAPGQPPGRETSLAGLDFRFVD